LNAEGCSQGIVSDRQPVVTPTNIVAHNAAATCDLYLGVIAIFMPLCRTSMNVDRPECIYALGIVPG
jgi:hypothetical protein